MADRVIVVGGGLAGIVAAFAAREAGAEVLVLDRSGAGLGSNSALANGYFAGPSPSYIPGDYVSDTIRIGKGLNCRWMVERMAADARDAFEFLRPLGFDWTLKSGFTVYREERPDVIRGAQMMRTLAEGLARQAGIGVEAGFRATEILQRDGRAVGVAGWDRNGRGVNLGSGAVILATGGAGALYARNDNQKAAFGHGYALAVRAGLTLADLEFVQFYPLVLAEPRLPSFMLYPDYPAECRVVDERGEDLARRHGLGDLNLAIKQRRDEFSARLFEESLRGRVFMDFTRVPASAWSDYPLALLGRLKFDFAHHPVGIAPGAHFFMGGVEIDGRGQTSLPGLFACGEVVGGLHGANRRGGNALTECVVFGRLAGTEAARAARAEASPLPGREEVPGPSSGRSPSYAPYTDLRNRLRQLAWLRAGVLRSRGGLEQGLSELAAWEEELGRLKPTGLDEVRFREDLECGSLVLRGILTASLARHESRGAFLTEEYPEAGEEKEARHSILTWESSRSAFRVEHRPEFTACVLAP